ncbi:MAG: hypothetical protein JXA33_15250 [Anaerolineae bacterium]|nr:hypothetical protein [Anaerolineae bacterium]
MERQDVMTLTELTQHSLPQVLWAVVESQRSLTIQLSSGIEIIIQPKPVLKALPELEGYVPHGWKEAIYDDAV